MQKFLEKINGAQAQKKPFSLGIYEVNLQNLENNIQKIRTHVENISGKKIQYLLPVKGAGYGCGMLEISHFVQKKKLCEYLGVAHVQEAFELRKSGITLPILVLGQTSSEEKFLDFIAEKNIEIALSDQKFLDKIESVGAITNRPYKISVHLKLDLGMGRCGVLEESAMKLFQKILDSSAVLLKGVMMHFPVSDSEEKQDRDFTKNQIQKFLEISGKMKLILGEKSGDVLFHCANSGATLEHPEAIEGFDMIRPGIASYGYPERGKTQEILGLEPVVQIYSQFTLIKEFPENFSIGYGRTYFTGKNSEFSEKIAIMPIGYADGLNRALSNTYSVFSESGEKFSCVGRISMDQSAYGVPENSEFFGENIPDSSKIFLLGKFSNACDLAKIQNTISYEVLINFGSSERLRKVWVY